jgi:hypothetical protein
MLWNEEAEQWKCLNALEGAETKRWIHCENNWLDEYDKWDFEAVNVVLRRA